MLSQEPGEHRCQPRASFRGASRARLVPPQVARQPAALDRVRDGRDDIREQPGAPRVRKVALITAGE